MRKSKTGQATVPLVVFILLAVVFGGLSANNYTKVSKNKKTLEQKQDNYKDQINSLQKKQKEMQKLVSLVGFNPEETKGNNPDAIIDAVMTKLGSLYISKEKELNIRFSPKYLFAMIADKKTTEHLLNSNISDVLRQKFSSKDNKYELSNSATVVYQNSQKDKWLIGGVGQSKQYYIEKERNRLKIYLLLDKDQLTSEKYVRKLPGLHEAWNACTKKIIYQSDNERSKGLVQQLEAKIDRLGSRKSALKREKKQTLEDITNAIGRIRTLQENHLEANRTYEGKLIEVKTKLTKLQEEKLQAKQKKLKLTRKLLYQRRKYQDIVENLDQRITELEQAATGQVTLKERLENALARIDEYEETKGQDSLQALLAEAKTTPDGKTNKQKETVEKVKPKIEKLKTQDTPDGQIVLVNNNNQTVFIDMGRAQGILPGLRFDVRHYVKGGIQKNKGVIVVRKIYPQMSMAGIVKITDPLEPIAIGDRIFNSVYDRNKIRYFVIAGRLEKYSTEEISNLVEKLGGKIEQEITAKTDFVVLGQGFREHPIYKRAQERGIAMILEAEFLRYFE